MNRIYNFNAGPATLPVAVLEECARGVLELNDSGMSVLEVSHRGKDYEAIHHAAMSGVLRLMGLSASDYAVLFMGGGASTQFAAVPMNLLAAGQSADYVNTGEWSSKAIKEAQRIEGVNVVASSEDAKFSYIPKNWSATPGARYVHITTNNTIEGTEYADIPDCGPAPLVADCSSDIFARVLDHSRFSLLYAGAQKNAGAAGVTIVVIKKSLLESCEQDLPTMLRYGTYAANDSLYNTPPVFAIYTLGLVIKWLEDSGGLAAMESRNRAKAAVIYSALDEHSSIYEPAVRDAVDRSLMNITFRLRDAGRESEFLAGAKKLGMEGLKGHRSVGGFRASVYNAFPPEGCDALAEYLAAFARRQ